MNIEARRQIERAADERRRAITEIKGPEYTGEGQNYTAEDADVLANFKNVGKRTGIDPLSVCLVYLGKHMDSIHTTVRLITLHRADDMLGRHAVAISGEGIESRLDDARNYLDILECLLVEGEVLA